jgi:hypothetical protein
MIRLNLILFLISFSISGLSKDIEPVTQSDLIFKPDVSIDMFGNTNWTYPTGYFESFKQKETTQTIEKPVISEKPTIKQNNFIKGSNIKQSIYVNIDFMGSFNGFHVGYGYTSNYFTHNIELRDYSNKILDSTITNSHIGLDYKLDFHVFPAWYVSNKHFTVLDAGISGIIGYGYNKCEDSLAPDYSIVQKKPFVGLGSFVNYKISEHVGLKGNLDILTGIGVQTNSSFNSTTSIGIFVDF